LEILVEIGNNEQQKIIANEFKVIETILNRFKPPLNIEKVIVPCDFIKTVNQIQNISSFNSDRGQEQIVLAKTIELNNSCILVFSPNIYTKGWDNQMRMSLYLHELIHAVNHRRIPKPITKSLSYNRLFMNLYILYNEYYANRKSFEVIVRVYPNKSKIFDDFIQGNFKSFLQSLIDNKYYEKIKSEISLFRIHGNIDLFLKEVHDIFDAAAKNIMYVYSYIDHFDFAKNQENLINKSNFINKKTKCLIDFYRSKYLKDDFDLISGINLMEDFLTNFGMRFEDRESGEDCYVLDI
jgi:hypothetical protein